MNLPAGVDASPRSLRWEIFAFCAWLVLLPLPLGSNRPWAMALTLPPLFALAAWLALRDRAALRESLAATLLRWPGVCLLAFLAVLAAQLVPVNGVPASTVPFRTLQYLLIALACVAAFWLTTALARTDAALKWLLGTLVAAATLQASIAVWLLATGTELPFPDTTITRGGVATGTFPNRNHLAGYLNMGLAAGIGLLMGSLAVHRPELTWRQRVRGWLELMLSGKARLRLVLVLIVIALILTRSRMGNASFFVGLLVAASIYSVFARRRRRGLSIFVASLVVVDLVLIGAWVGVDKVVERFQETPLLREAVQAAPAAGADTTAAGATSAGVPAPAEATQADAGPPKAAPRRHAEQSVEQRVEPAVDAVAVIRDFPWLGTGGGTFYLAFMQYTQHPRDYYSHAHNDYLELAADVGLPGTAALVLLAASAFAASVRLLRDRRNVTVRAAAFASLMAVTCMALHATVDFNLQIPSNALTFTVMVALPFAAAAVPSRRRSRHGRESAGDELPRTRERGDADQDAGAQDARLEVRRVYPEAPVDPER